MTTIKQDEQAPRIKVWIVEDDSMFRKGLVRALRRQKELDCSEDFPSCEALFEYAEQQGRWPDVLLMDIGLIGVSGLEGIQKISEIAPDVKTLVLTVFSEKEKLYEAFDAGASGYLLKRASVAEIVRGIQDVVEGETVLDNQVIKYILDYTKKEPPSSLNLAPQELEVVKQLSKGFTKDQIADAMNLSVHTVDCYLRRIYKKMGVHSQSAAVARALKDKLL